MTLGIFKIFSAMMGQTRSRIHPATHFRAVIERERSRADRSDAVFSLVAVDQAFEHHAPSVVEFLSQRLRVTDDFGMLDDGRLGVVLPDTDTAGAWKVADDISAYLATRESHVACEVFTYPGNLHSDESDDGQQEHAASFRHEASEPCDERLARPMVELLYQALPWWKRSVDIAVSTIAIVMLLPLFGLITFAIKLTSKGPVFFCQTRSGLAGRPFKLYKFRSMVTDAEALKATLEDQNEVSGPVFKIAHDPRITSIGRWLRRSSLDELPQLWNVLRGDMSLVGPRPPIPSETFEYDGWHHRRLEVTPGITCIWQVSGRSNIPFTEWMRMDIRYAQKVSIREDLRILLKTAPAVLSGNGAN